MSGVCRLYLIAYDVSNNRRRTRLVRVAQRYALRVQGSVFEGWMKPAEAADLLRRAKPLLNPAEDSLRLYPVCAACREGVIALGRGQLPEQPDEIVV